MKAATSATEITGRFTLEELEHLIGTLAWPRGVPETVSERDQQELKRLFEVARKHLTEDPGACAVDILEGQILNVVVG